MAIIEASKDALIKPLATVTGIVEKRHTMPILSNVLIEKQGSNLRMLGTDLEIQIQTTDTLDNQSDDVRFTTSAKKLLDILRALPDSQPVKLETDNNKLTIRSGKSRFNLHTLPAEDLPQVQMNSDVLTTLEIAQSTLKSLLQKVQYAMANQDIRYYLNGLYLVSESGMIKLVATDGHRLAFVEAETGNQSPRSEAIIPRKTVLELVKQLNDVDDPVKIEICSNQIRFSFGKIELLSKVIEGKFPDYNRVIPLHNNKIFRIERLVLLQALQRVAILSNEKFRGVRVMLSDNTLRIQSANNEQEEAQEELDIEYGYDALDIGFNINYLLDALNHSSSDVMQLALADSNGSALVTEPENQNFRYVVMPMRI
ncbi:DNA polymerase III subunit beta [Leeia oryzae]|uniref:DNA polymerase III subunit beta n=1 Tax=Leeia oryzae TaxID=356662 RepID=UPI000380DF3E|nr:DNA polymerase III subunit beta [Leeia oryzae]